jgi:hypothetical protein
MFSDKANRSDQIGKVHEIWVNYNDLTAFPNPGMMARKGDSPNVTYIIISYKVSKLLMG